MSSERFYFDNGQPKNPWWLYKNSFTTNEKYILERIALAGGILGRTPKSLNGSKIANAELEGLEKTGLIKKIRLKERAIEVINDPIFQQRSACLKYNGGFLEIANKVDRMFFRSFDLAEQIADGCKTNYDPNELRYVITQENLFYYIEATVSR